MTPASIRNDSKRRLSAANPAFNGIDFLEVLDQQAVPLGSPRQQTLLVHFLEPAPALTIQNLQTPKAAYASLRSMSSGRSAKRSPARRPRRPSKPSCDAEARRRHTWRRGFLRRFSTYRQRGPVAGELRAACRIRFAIRVRRAVQGGMPQRVRLPDRSNLPTANCGKCTADQLCRQGLFELPQSDARSSGRHHAGMAGAESRGRRNGIGGGSGLCGRSPQLLPGRGGDGGLPGHSATQQGTPCPFASITRCTMAAMRACGFTSTLRREAARMVQRFQVRRLKGREQRC